MASGQLLHINMCALLNVAGDFMKEQGVYEDILKFHELKKLMEEQLEDYNMEPGIISMGLVLFRDAIEHGIRRTYVCTYNNMCLYVKKATCR